MHGHTRIACTIFMLLLVFAQGTVLANGNVIRLHVIANSNSPEDQQLKEQVRDQIIAELGPVFAEMEQRQVAAWLEENQDVLVNLASAVVMEAGADCPVQVHYKVEDYPLRAYREKIYPEGKYRSVQIVLGKGQGRNWWCLLFPPLCFVSETVTEELSDDQEIQGRIWLWDQIKELFQRLFC
jgi:stage II sporulation protein R